MALIKCKECGKEISDKATACPHCGCPVQTTDEAKVEVQGTTNIKTADQQQNMSALGKKKKGHGCLVPIIIVLVFVVALGASMIHAVKDSKQNPEKYKKHIVTNYIDVTADQGSAIDAVLAECGIESVKDITHDELLDNAHVDGETGYRICVSDNIDNVILYLNADKTVYGVRYADYDLYVDGNVVATLQDYTFTTDEASDLMIKCEDKVKEVLKSPSTAKFPNILEWGFGKEKNIATVQGYVDAQNSFGAETRSNFQFIIDTDTNTIQSFIFDGQEMITQ
jgi:hypothetical protein